jgi:hypothetical protein
MNILVLCIICHFILDSGHGYDVHLRTYTMHARITLSAPIRAGFLRCLLKVTNMHHLHSPSAADDIRAPLNQSSPYAAAVHDPHASDISANATHGN